MKLASRLVELVVASAIASGGLVLASAPAQACESDGYAAVDGILVKSECEEPGSGDGEPAAYQVESKKKYLQYVWADVCRPFNPNMLNSVAAECGAARTCPDPGETLWDLWAQRPEPDPGWDLLGSECLGQLPEIVAPDPQVTPAMVLNALRRIGLPALEARTQPADKTLVNFDTIFFAEPQTFTRTLTLLGQQVDVEATPSSFLWHHGDGTATSTQTAGAPYPAKDITYQYTDAHTTVLPSVDVTYTARFRVNGGAWQDIGETVTISGPAGNLRVSEARPVLSGDYG